MPAPIKPSLFLNWTDGTPPKVTQPPSSLQSSGWLPGEAPPPDFMNWLFWLTDSWIQWLDYEIENVIDNAVGILAASNILTTTGNTTIGSEQLTLLASTTGLQLGMLITGVGIPANTYLVSLVGATATMSRNATSNGVAISVTFSHVYATGANVQVQLDQVDAQLSEIAHLFGALTGASDILYTTGNITNLSTQLVSLASVVGVMVGTGISGTGIPANTVVSAISGTTVTMSLPATATTVGLQVTFSENYATGASIQTQISQLDAKAKRLQTETAFGNGNKSIVAAYTVVGDDMGKVLEINTTAGAFSIQFPPPALFINRAFSLQDVGGVLNSKKLTGLRNAAEQIQGLAANYIFQSAFGRWIVWSDGTNWWLF